MGVMNARRLHPSSPLDQASIRFRRNHCAGLPETPPAAKSKQGPPRTAATEVLSPELILVCPELRAFALEQLTERDPDAFLERRAVGRLQSESIEVDRPELGTRERGSPDGIGRRENVSAPVLEQPLDPVEEGVSSLALSAFAYAARRAVVVAVQGAAILVALAAVVVLTDVIKP